MEIDSTLESSLYPEEARSWGMLIHLSAFSLFFTGIGYLLGPLVFWLLKREESSFVDKQGKEALNFQITSTAYFIVVALLSFKLHLLIYPIFLLLIAWMVFVIQGALAANEGRSYRYPLTLRLVR